MITSPISAEAQLIAAAQRGDTAAFGEIVRQYHRLIFSLVYRQYGDPELAEDVSQDTFLAAWLKLSTFRPQQEGSLRSWLCRIAHNRAIDLMRQQRPTAELDPTLAHTDPPPLALALQHETATVVQESIRRLPELGRAALILREYEGMSYAEIATALDIPIGTVMSRLHNARRQLAADLLPLLHPTADDTDSLLRAHIDSAKQSV